jgi:hypothetical protein
LIQTAPRAKAGEIAIAKPIPLSRYLITFSLTAIHIYRLFFTSFHTFSVQRYPPSDSLATIMRLLHVDFDPEQKGHVQISLCDHMETENQDLRYAIFSHSWQKDEVLFADVAEPDRALSEATKNKSGFVKLETCCRIALDHGLHYVWSDTCCVDRNSSADVSESVNALFRYYSEAEICIVYLDDVQDHAKDTFFLDRSTWFSESWNLQALVASRDLHYYSQGWIKLGSKASLSRVTSQASGVPERVLVDPSSLDSICVSEKMSWAARRTTTRAEDRAYSLMGLFDVNMPLL